MLRETLKLMLIILLTVFFVGFGAGMIYGIQDAAGEPLIGQDTLALMHPKFKWKNYHDRGTALSVLDWTFGVDLNKLKNAIEESHPHSFRVHLLNTVCVRNGNCGRYEPLAGYTITSLDRALRENRAPELLKWVKQRTRIYKHLLSDFPQTKALISPALEHNLSQVSFRVLADAVLEIWPEVQLVNSALDGRGERYRCAWREGHGPLAPTDIEINSLDGVDATDIAINSWLKRFRNIRILYVWSRGYNCRNQGPFEDPRQRDSCPTGATLELLQHITDNRGPAPRHPPNGTCSTVSAFKSPAIWKPLAEDKGTGDPRANLPVVIFPGTRTKVEVLGVDGRSKGYLGYYGPYQAKDNRYYSGQIGSGKSGYQFSSGYAWLRQGRKCKGPLITGRRQGTMRDGAR